MVKYTKNTPVDIELYEKRIKGDSFILVDRNILEEGQRAFTAESYTMSFMYQDCMMHKSACNCISKTKDSIINYLVRYEHCPERYFATKKSESLSLDMKRVCEPLFYNGYACEFLDYYMEYRHLISKSNGIKKLLAECGNDVVKGATGDLIKLRYDVNRQVNRRFNYNNFDIIAKIPKKISHCIGVEDGYALVWGDFAQSDFRIAYNLFIRSDENDLVMDKYEDKYEAMARIVNKTLGVPFDPEKFKAERKQYKTQMLGTFYGKRHSMVKEENAFIQRFSKFLETCPKYVEFQKRLSDSHDLGIPIVIDGYFGSEESSPVFYKREDTVNRALNAPIQGGTSDMIIITVNDILDRFYARGWTEDDISLYMVRHDEPIFKVKLEALKDSWIFEDYNQIFVDNWSPLKITFDVGYQYGVRDKELYDKYRSCVEENKDKLGIFEKEVFVESEYYPVKKVARTEVWFNKMDNESIVTILDSERMLASSFVVFSNDDEQIFKAIQQKFANSKFSSDFRGVIVHNDLQDTEDFQSGMYFRYLKKAGPSNFNLITLCNYITYVYCKNNGKECPVNPPNEGFKNFLSSLGKFKEFGE